MKCSHESAGKKTAGHGNKIGNAHLKWAFSEAAVIMLHELSGVKSFVARLEKKHGKSKAISILAARIGGPHRPHGVLDAQTQGVVR